MFYDAFCVFVFIFLSFDATAQQRLDGFPPNLHQTYLQCYSLIVVHPWQSVTLKFLRPKTSIFGGKIHTPPFSDGRCAEKRKNFGKTKATTIFRLPSFPSLVKFDAIRLGHLSYWGLINCAFSPIGHSAYSVSLPVAVRKQLTVWPFR